MVKTQPPKQLEEKSQSRQNKTVQGQCATPCIILHDLHTLNEFTSL